MFLRECRQKAWLLLRYHCCVGGKVSDIVHKLLICYKTTLALNTKLIHNYNFRSIHPGCKDMKYRQEKSKESEAIY